MLYECYLEEKKKYQSQCTKCSRRIIVRIIDEKGIEELKKRILLNLQDLLKMIDWNEENGIKVFSLSSELIFNTKQIQKYLIMTLILL